VGAGWAGAGMSGGASCKKNPKSSRWDAPATLIREHWDHAGCDGAAAARAFTRWKVMEGVRGVVASRREADVNNHGLGCERGRSRHGSICASCVRGLGARLCFGEE
jgi:hypothetical protein